VGVARDCACRKEGGRGGSSQLLADGLAAPLFSSLPDAAIVSMQ
jgi:hypothetical protein